MKKTLIFFIIMVVGLTYSFTRPTVYKEEYINNEAAKYRNSLLNSYEKTGDNISEELLDNMVQDYIELSVKKNNGMQFGEALKTSLIISVICFGGFFLIIFLRRAHYSEFFGGHFASGRITDNTELYKRKVRYDHMKRIRDAFLKNK